MTNTEDYQPQGTDISVDHFYDFCHFGAHSTDCFCRAPWTYLSYLSTAHPKHYSVSAVFSTLNLLQSSVQLRNHPGTTRARTHWKHWHGTTIRRFVPRDWGIKGFKMLVSEFGTSGTQYSGRCHEHKQELDRRRNCIKTNKMRYLTFPSSPRDPCLSHLNSLPLRFVLHDSPRCRIMNRITSKM